MPGTAAVRARPLAVLDSVWAGRAMLAFAFGWFAFYWDRPGLPSWVAWLAPAYLSAHGAVSCRATADSMPADARPFWRLLMKAGCCAVGASLSQAYDAIAPPGPPTQRSGALTMAVYLAAGVILAHGLLRLPYTRRERPDWFTFGLDIGIVTVTVALFTWHFSARFGPGLQALRRTPSTSLGIITAAMVAVAIVLKLGVGGLGPIDRRAVQGLALAAALAIAGGSAAGLIADRPWLNTSQLAIPAALGALAGSAHAQRRRPATRAPTRPIRAYSLVPYLAVAAAYALLLAVLHAGGPAEGIGVGVAVLTGLVMVRQVAALRENARLLAQVDRNMVDLQASEDRLTYQASHDGLTDLADRALFGRRLAAALAADPDRVAAALIDLDDFKAINDRLGHDVGDAVLVAVAGRLTGCVRGTDLVARLGGDEFVVLLADTDQSQARRTVERILASLAAPVSVAGHDLLVNASIGLAVGAPGRSDAALLRQADVAMYAAKERGKDGWLAYQPDFDVRASETAELGAALRQGLDRGEFSLVYQPIVAIADGAMWGVEALVRWHRSDRGAVSAADFIPAAERSGLIVPLGRWVLAQACAQVVRWQERFGSQAPNRLNVNVSARQLREPGFAAEVASVLGATGLDPAVLMVEVTETTVFDGGPAVAALEALTQLGVGVALDDFGTGHSSLSLLRTCPVDMLKLDKSFVDGVLGTSEEAVIATYLVQIADGLRLMTVAEGVESDAQAQRLQALGYRYAQGYHFAPPLPAPELETRMAASMAVA
jgi:diguanylate cyclase